MKQQDVKLIEKPWIRNLISFSTGIVAFILIGGIPLIIYSKRVDAVIPMIFFGVIFAPIASGLICGLLVHEKRSYIIIITFPILLLSVGYIILYATGAMDWVSPVFPAIGGGVALLFAVIGSQFVESRREKKQFMRMLEDQ